ncbi:MAG TPA: phosphate-starvation-inducible PsiE family protein [Rhodanobacteraceae bacterium]
MKQEQAESLYRRIHDGADIIGAALADVLHYLILLAIGIAIVWSGAAALAEMMTRGHIAIRDILLLFIYLELIAMIGVHFRTKHLPVRFLIYVAITALTRMLIINVQADHSATIGVVLTAGSILLLALAALVVRYGSHRFPADHSLHVEHAHDASHVKTY